MSLGLLHEDVNRGMILISISRYDWLDVQNKAPDNWQSMTLQYAQRLICIKSELNPKGNWKHDRKKDLSPKNLFFLFF